MTARRILLVEDSEDDAFLIGEHLRRAGIQEPLTRVVDGRQMTEALSTEAFDLVLCDYNLPGFGVEQALKLLRDISPEVSLIVVSGAVGEETAVEMMRLGAKDYVLKDALGRLPAAVRRELKEVGERRAATAVGAELQRLEVRYASLIESVPVIIFTFEVVDDALSVRWINRRVSAVLGYAAQDMIDDPGLLHRLIRPEDARRLLDDVADPGSGSQPHVCRVMDHGRRLRWLRIWVSSDPTESGFQGMALDITDEVTAGSLAERARVLTDAVATLGLEALTQTDLGMLFARAQDLLVSGFGCDFAKVIELWEDGSLHHRTENGDTKIDPVTSLAGRTLTVEGPLIVRDTSKDASLADQDLVFHGLRSALSIPIRTSNRVLGVVSIYSKSPDRFTDVDVPSVQSIANVLGDAIQRHKNETDLRKSLDELSMADRERRRLLSSLLTAQEDERKRVAADIHDDSVQMIAAISLRLTMIREQSKSLPPDLLTRIADVEGLVQKCLAGLRALLFNLRPPFLDDGLIGAVRKFIEKSDFPADIAWDVSGDVPPDIDEEVVTAIYRIVTEAITNVRKHSRSKTGRVVLRQTGRGLEAEVSDEGVGFTETVQNPPTGHLGITSMRERAELAGGWLRIDPSDRGTRVKVWIPIDLDHPAAASA